MFTSQLTNSYTSWPRQFKALRVLHASTVFIMIILILCLHIKPSIISFLETCCLKARWILAAHSCMRMNLSSYSLSSFSLYAYSYSLYLLSCSKRILSSSILRYSSSLSRYSRSLYSYSRISYSYISICLILSISYNLYKYDLKALYIFLT